jgi:regulator of protease activity HflC (stomatin/prohibitin superfamily)
MSDVTIIIVLIVVGILVVFGLYMLCAGIRVLKQFDKGVVYRLGVCKQRPIGPGMVWINPILSKMVVVDIRTQSYDIPSQDVITKDNVSLRVDGIVYF